MSDYTSHIDTDATELELMERYLDGSLSDDEKKVMEENLAEDPILADALEGLALIEDKEAMRLALGRIQEVSQGRINKYVKKRDQLSKRRSRVEHGRFKLANYYVAAAASIAVLVCTFWVINVSSERKAASFAQNEAAPENRMDRSENMIIEAAPIGVDTLNEKEESKAADEAGSSRSRYVEFAKPKSSTQSVPNQEEILAERNVSSDKNELEKLSSPLKDSPTDSRKEVLVQEKVPSVEKPIEQELAEADNKTIGNTLDETSSKAKTAESDLADDVLEEKAPPIARKQKAMESEIKPELATNSAPVRLEDTSILSADELSKIPLESLAEQDKYAELENKNDRARNVPAKKRAKKSTSYDTMPAFPNQPEEDRLYGKLSKGQHLADLMTEAVALYEAKSNEESLVLLKEVLQNTPENPAANYYTGSIYYRYSQMKTASSYLKEASKFPQSPLFEDAQWKLAQVYLARNKNGLAKKLLQKIATEGNKFAEQARIELSKL